MTPYSSYSERSEALDSGTLILRYMPAFKTQTKHLRIAIDTGGTFTDCVWLERGRIRLLKVFSTPDDPSQAIADALEKIGFDRPIALLHGTTVGTNTLLQRKGARVALVTTAGFEDVIDIGRQNRPKLYDFFFDRIEPLVPAELRFGVNERIASDGTVVGPLAADEVDALAKTIREAAPDAVAVSLLFSFANPRHEAAIAALLRPMELPLSISHKILPEFREYERTSTVVVNAYLQPVMQKYLENLARRVEQRASSSRIFVMQSSGGITALSSAASEPVRTVLSGPAGGVVGAAEMGRRSGFDRIISFDMGGTSTDVALVDREVHAANQAEVSGLPINVPLLDIHTVGAGGGSLARFDQAGALRVGPESAGADPGPICYGRGTQPTVTDANLLLGRLQPQFFLGGDFTLDLERTQRIVSEWLRKQGSPLTVERFAAGVVRVVNSTMERAIRVVSVERGYDPREFTLVAFGGAGGLHACELAQALAIPRVIIPALPGALSAFGILVSDVVKDYSRTVLWKVEGQIPHRKLADQFAELRQLALRDLRGEGWSGAVQYRSSVDVRYQGQGYELNIPYSRELADAFREEHCRSYGYDYTGRCLELVTLRLRALIKSKVSPESKPIAEKRSSRVDELARVHFGGKTIPTHIRDRNAMREGKKYDGPAVITEYSATTAVPPRKRFWIDSAGNLIIEVRTARN